MADPVGKCAICSGVSCRDSSCPKYVRYVQVLNPKTGHYVKIDRAEGRLLGTKRDIGPYEGVPVVEKEKRG